MESMGDLGNHACSEGVDTPRTPHRFRLPVLESMGSTGPGPAPTVLPADGLADVWRIVEAERTRLARLVPAVERITARRRAPQMSTAPAPTARASGLLTRREAADALAVSLTTLDRMRADGQLAIVTIRRRVFIPATEVRRIAASAVRGTIRGDVRHREGVVVAGPLW